jgi:hypothetical protein
MLSHFPDPVENAVDTIEMQEQRLSLIRGTVWYPNSKTCHPENVLYRRGITVRQLTLRRASYLQRSIELHGPARRLHPGHDRRFDSGPFRNVQARWHFPQGNTTWPDLQFAVPESKPL